MTHSKINKIKNFLYYFYIIFKIFICEVKKSGYYSSGPEYINP